MMKRFFCLSLLSLVLPACSSNDEVTCGLGTRSEGNTCVPNPCSPGTHLVDHRCVSDAACGPETQLVDGQCVPVPPGKDFVDATSWNANVVVSQTGWGAEPQLAVDSHHAIFVTSMEAVSAKSSKGQISMYKSTDLGKTFSLVKTIVPASGRSLGDVTVAVDSADRVFWGWTDYGTDSQGASTGKVFVSISTDGETFPDAQQVSAVDSDNTFCDRPWLSLARDGSMYVSWTNGPPLPRSGESGVSIGARYARSDSGNPFAAQQTVFDPSTRGYDLEETPLAFDTHGQPASLSSTYGNGSVYSEFAYSITAWHSENGTWSNKTITPLVYGRHFTFETYPLIASDSDGILTAIFLNGFSREIVPYAVRSTDDGQTWTAPVEVINGVSHPSATALPWVTTDGKKRVHLMWLDNRYGAWVPYTASTDDGVTFSPAERIGDASFIEDGSYEKWIGDFNSIVVRDGGRYAVWTDTRSGTSQVYFASAPDK